MSFVMSVIYAFMNVSSFEDPVEFETVQIYTESAKHGNLDGLVYLKE